MKSAIQINYLYYYYYYYYYQFDPFNTFLLNKIINFLKKKIIIIITDHKLLNIVTQNLLFELTVLFSFLFIKNITGPKKS